MRSYRWNEELESSNIGSDRIIQNANTVIGVFKNFIPLEFNHKKDCVTAGYNLGRLAYPKIYGQRLV